MLLCFLACTREPPSIAAPTLTAINGHREPWSQLVAQHQYTVLIFVARQCHCLSAHITRVRLLAGQFMPRGVQFLAVDSEVGTTLADVATETTYNALPFPTLLDRDAQLADAFGADYATYTVIVDHQGHVVYRGGIDSDQVELHEHAQQYVKDALEDLLAGRPVRARQRKAFGCALRKS